MDSFIGGGSAIAAATALAMQKAPKGTNAKIAVTGVSKVGDLFAANVAVEFVPVAENKSEAEANSASLDDGKETDKAGEGKSGDGGGASKSSEAPDVYALSLLQQKGLDASIPDTSMLPLETAGEKTPVIQFMEQLPDPDQDLLKAGVQDTQTGPETLNAEAVLMAEEMKHEFNDRPEEILIITNGSVTPAAQAAAEAHNQKELDAEETRRELAEANAALSQKEAATPNSLT